MLEGGGCCTQTRVRQHKHKPPHTQRDTSDLRYYCRYNLLIPASHLAEFHPVTLNVTSRFNMLQILYWCQNLIQISLFGSLESFQSQPAVLRLRLFCHFTQKWFRTIIICLLLSVIGLWVCDSASLPLLGWNWCNVAAVTTPHDLSTQHATLKPTMKHVRLVLLGEKRGRQQVIKAHHDDNDDDDDDDDDDDENRLSSQQQQQQRGSGDLFPPSACSGPRRSPERLPPELSSLLTQATGDTAFRETGAIFFPPP